LTVGIQYGGRDIEIKPISEGNPGGDYYIPPIPPDSDFVLNLTYNGKVDGKLGVIAKFNGASTWQQETGESVNLRKWIYNRETNLNKPDPFKGFYVDVEGNYLPFKVLTAAESEAKQPELGGRVGWIDIDVFASGDAKTQDEPKRVTSRGLPHVIDAKNKKILPAKPATLKEAQDQLSQLNHVQRSLVRRRSADEGGIIIPGEAATAGGPLTQGQLPNPVLIGTLHIRYYDPSRLRVTAP